MVTKIEESSNVFSCKNELDITISNINNLFKNLIEEILFSRKGKTGHKLMINTNFQLEFKDTWKIKRTYNIYQKIYIVKELLNSLEDFNFFYQKMILGMERFVSNYKKQGISKEALLFLSLFLRKSIEIGAEKEQIRNLDYHLTRLKGNNTKKFFENSKIDINDLKKNWKNKDQFNIEERITILDFIKTKEEFYLFYSKISRSLSYFIKYHIGNNNKALFFLKKFVGIALNFGIEKSIIDRLYIYIDFLEGKITSLKNISKISRKSIQNGVKVKKVKKSISIKMSDDLKIAPKKVEKLDEKEKINNFNIVKTFSKKEIIDNLSLKGKREKDKKFWYEIGIEKLNQSINLIDIDFSKLLINKLKIKNLVDFYNGGFFIKDDKLEEIIFLRLQNEFYLKGDALILYKKLFKKIK